MKKILFVIVLLLMFETFAFGANPCGLPLFRVATVHETTLGGNERFRVSSYFIPDPDDNFDTASTLATIEWKENLYTYIWHPDFRVVHEGLERFMFAVLYPTQATPLELDELENVTYRLNIGDGSCEFSLPENSFFWLDIPYAAYDQTTRTVSWTPIADTEVSYSVRIYPPLLDGSPNVGKPLFSKSVSSDETHYVFPNAAPALPGNYVAVQAARVAVNTANFSRDFIKIPAVYKFDGKIVITGD